MLTVSDEGGEQPCLDLVPGRVRRLPAGLKVPHMGWNQVQLATPHPLFDGVPDGSNFYFVHSYYCEPEVREAALGTTDYGVNFCSVLAQRNLLATQFHPEKSGDVGLQIYQNFLRFAAR
jgi:glutamine amidotransferase